MAVDDASSRKNVAAGRDATSVPDAVYRMRKWVRIPGDDGVMRVCPRTLVVDEKDEAVVSLWAAVVAVGAGAGWVGVVCCCVMGRAP